MTASEKEKFLRILESEKKSAFRKGLVIGILIPVLLLSLVTLAVSLSHTYFEKKIGEILVTKVVTEVFTAFPDAYFTSNRERVIAVFDQFTNAASKHQVSSAEFRKVGSFFLTILKDRRITWAEMDQLLSLMQEAAK